MYHNFLKVLWYFNSQPHKEADKLLSVLSVLLGHFNSQPHKEADNADYINAGTILVFQLTASQGG